VRLLNRKDYKVLAQSISEICVLMFVVIIALGSIQLYVKRALQARYKGSVDAAVTMALLATNVYAYKQYEPYYKDEHFTGGSKQLMVETFGQEQQGQFSRSRAQVIQDSNITSRSEADFGKESIWRWEE
jgi:hypothetical protein